MLLACRREGNARRVTMLYGKRVKMLQSLCLVVWPRLLETTVLQGSRLKAKRWKSLSGGVTWHLYFLMQPNEPGRCGRHESD